MQINRKRLKSAGRCDCDASHTLITEAEGVPLISSYCQGCQNEPCFPQSFLKIKKRSIAAMLDVRKTKMIANTCLLTFKFLFVLPFYSIELSAILRKSLDRLVFCFIFTPEDRSSVMRASITIVHIRKFCKISFN